MSTPTKPKSITILQTSEFELLNWKNWSLFPNMVRIRTIPDGSCFFHAIANGHLIPYRTGLLDGKAISKREIVAGLRHDLSKMLGMPIDPTDPEGPTNYDSLSHGGLAEFSKGHPEYTLKNMQKQLDSNSAVDNVYVEFISNQLNLDIYLLDLNKQEIYITGKDDDLYFKNRNSIVIGYLPGHYELIGLYNNTTKEVSTYFKPSHPFIMFIRKRLTEVRDRGSKQNKDDEE